MQTDSKDAKILDILKKNSRESFSVIGGQTGLSDDLQGATPYPPIQSMYCLPASSHTVEPLPLRMVTGNLWYSISHILLHLHAKNAR